MALGAATMTVTATATITVAQCHLTDAAKCELPHLFKHLAYNSLVNSRRSLSEKKEKVVAKSVRGFNAVEVGAFGVVSL